MENQFPAQGSEMAISTGVALPNFWQRQALATAKSIALPAKFIHSGEAEWVFEYPPSIPVPWEHTALPAVTSAQGPQIASPRYKSSPDTSCPLSHPRILFQTWETVKSNQTNISESEKVSAVDVNLQSCWGSCFIRTSSPIGSWFTLPLLPLIIYNSCLSKPPENRVRQDFRFVPRDNLQEWFFNP